MKQTFKFTTYIVVMVMVGLMVGSGFLPATASKNAPVPMVPQNFSALADTVSPAVVHIRGNPIGFTFWPKLLPPLLEL